MAMSFAKKVVCVFGALATIAGVLLLEAAANQMSPFFGWTGFVLIACGLFGCAWGFSVTPLTSAERRERAAWLFGFGPGANKVRQVAETIGLILVMLCGLLVSVKALEQFRPVDANALFIFPILIITCMLVFSQIDYLKSMGTPRGIVRITGWPLFVWISSLSLMTGFIWGGILFWVNGALDHTQEVHRVSLIDKRASTGKGREFVVDVQSWQDSGRQIRLTVPEKVYQRLEVGNPVEITVGSGVLHIEWVRSISLPER
jgi:hypothetical protein